jgi:hypothetical protein
MLVEERVKPQISQGTEELIGFPASSFLFRTDFCAGHGPNPCLQSSLKSVVKVSEIQGSLIASRPFTIDTDRCPKRLHPGQDGRVCKM